jgi:hypothetical protein
VSAAKPNRGPKGRCGIGEGLLGRRYGQDDGYCRVWLTPRRRDSTQPWLTEPRVATRQVVRVHQEMFSPEATRVLRRLCLVTVVPRASCVQRVQTITSRAMRPADGSAIARPRVDAIPRRGKGVNGRGHVHFRRRFLPDVVGVALLTPVGAHGELNFFFCFAPMPPDKCNTIYRLVTPHPLGGARVECPGSPYHGPAPQARWICAGLAVRGLRSGSHPPRRLEAHLSRRGRHQNKAATRHRSRCPHRP